VLNLYLYHIIYYKYFMDAKVRIFLICLCDCKIFFDNQGIFDFFNIFAT